MAGLDGAESLIFARKHGTSNVVEVDDGRLLTALLHVGVHGDSGMSEFEEFDEEFELERKMGSQSEIFFL